MSCASRVAIRRSSHSLSSSIRPTETTLQAREPGALIV